VSDGPEIPDHQTSNVHGAPFAKRTVRLRVYCVNATEPDQLAPRDRRHPRDSTVSRAIANLK
jgi:hypothetical protein